MGTLIGQELYKLTHRTGTWVGLAILPAVQLAFALLAAKYPEQFVPAGQVNADFGGMTIVLFIAIATTASIISMEFQYGTIKQLLYREYYRSQVFLSKIVLVLVHFFALKAVSIAVTFGISLVLFRDQYSLTGKMLSAYGRAQFGSVLLALFLLSIVLLISTWFKTNAAAIVMGFVGYMVVDLGSLLMIFIIRIWSWLKWSPLTFILAGNQVVDEQMKTLTHFGTPAMIAGSLVYTVVFAGLGYLSFRRRSV